MKNMPFDERIPIHIQQQMSYMQSSKQIGATAYMLYNMDTAFSPIFAIQMASFLMTLVRKNIINSTMWHILYNFTLQINAFFYIFPSTTIEFIITHFIIFMIYVKIFFKIKLNKYIGWSIIFGLYSLKQELYPFIFTDAMKYCDIYQYESYLRNAFVILWFILELIDTRFLFYNLFCN
jgi:hypothetical protein